MLGRHHPHDPSSTQHFLPNLLPTDEEDSDEGDDAAAIAEALVGRKPPPQPPSCIPVPSEAKQCSLEEGQVCEDQVSCGQTPATSLLDRLGPPSLSASLTSVSSSGRRNHQDQADPHLPSIGAASAQLPDAKPLRLCPDDQKPPGEVRPQRGQKRPHSPRRRRNHSRSRSPNRHRQSPPASDGRRRASLSARITHNNRRSSCSPESPKLDLSSRSKWIARRFSSPSNSAHYRRDPRDRETPSSWRYHPNASDPRRSRQADLHPPCKLVVQEPNNIPIPNPGSISKSPSLNSPDRSNIASTKVSVLVANLPSYYVLTPKRLYEHLTDPVYRQRSLSGMPYELKLYRYTRSDCIVGELKFNSLEDARQFTQKVDRAWPPSWYTTKKPPHSRQKNVELNVLEDKQIAWPSNYETYSPQGQRAQAQADKSTGVVDAPAPRPVIDTAKIKSKPDYLDRPKPSRLSQEANAAAGEREDQPTSHPHSDKCKPVADPVSTPVNGSGSPSSLTLKDANASLAKVQLDSDDRTVMGEKASSTQTPADKDGQQVHPAPTSNFVSAPISHLMGDTNLPHPMGLHSATQKSPQNAFSQLASHMSTAEKSEDTKSSVLLSNLHPSLTWPVLQSHFSFPNRPRHFRIFQPFQVAYGSFSLTDPTKSSLDHSARSQEGCMISFNDANTARNFCRVLEQNPPFQSVQVRLVDAADIEFVPSASIIRNPHDQDYVESVSANDPANQFIQNSLLDFQNQLNWTPVMHPEMPTPMELNPLGPMAKPAFANSNYAMQSDLSMQPDLSCSVYPFPYGNEYQSEYQSSMLGYPQSCSSVPIHYPYNPPSHNAQTFPQPINPPDGFNATTTDVTFDTKPDISFDAKPDVPFDIKPDVPFDIKADVPFDIKPDVPFDAKPDAQQALQDRLKRILKERKAKSGQTIQ